MIILTKSYREKIEPLELKFRGYFTKENLPQEKRKFSRIYTVYAGKIDVKLKLCFLRKLLYIGESTNVASRMQQHERDQDWDEYLKSGELPLFAYTEVAPENRERIEAALIYYHYKYKNLTLLANTQHKKSFGYPDTYVKISGKAIKFLNKEEFWVTDE